MRVHVAFGSSSVARSRRASHQAFRRRPFEKGTQWNRPSEDKFWRR